VRLQGWARVVLVCALALWGAREGAAARTTITYWYFDVTELTEAFIKEAVAAFNESQSAIYVEAIRQSGNMYDQTLTAIAGGAAPDVIYFERSAVIEWVAGRGRIFEPLDRYLSEELRAPDAFLPFAREEIEYEGQIWALPFGTDVRGLIWNMDHLDEAGLDASRAPATLDELVSYALRLTKQSPDGEIAQLGFAPWLGNWRLQGWFWAFGGGVFDREQRMPTIDIEANRQAVHWVQDFAQRLGAAAVRFPAGIGPFTAGQLSMSIEANVTYELARRTAPDLRIGVGAVPHAPGGRNGTWSGGYAHVIPAGAKHVAEAAAFLNFLNSPAMQVRQFEVTGGLPTGTAAFFEVLRRPHEDGSLAFLEQLPVSNGRPPLWLAVHLALGDAMNAVIHMQKSPEQVLAEVQQHMEQQFAEVLGW